MKELDKMWKNVRVWKVLQEVLNTFFYNSPDLQENNVLESVPQAVFTLLISNYTTAPQIDTIKNPGNANICRD